MKISPSWQLRVLYKVFLLRVIDLEVLSAEGSTAKLLGQFGAVFAGISFLFVLPLILTSGALAETDVWTMAHLLIATTFTAVGLSTILAWDSLVPDRRDVLILGPLPLHTRTLFFAKLAGVGALPALVIASVNVFTGLTWPFLFATHSGVAAASQLC
jgi:quinol-cytochrome oxidoreductase complex cytochrome b subunit